MNFSMILKNLIFIMKNHDILKLHEKKLIFEFLMINEAKIIFWIKKINPHISVSSLEALFYFYRSFFIFLIVHYWFFYFYF